MNADFVQQSESINKALKNMHDRTVSSKYFSKMKTNIQPFCDYFGLNHFYFTQFFSNRGFASFGLNTAWHEYAFENPQDLVFLNTHTHSAVQSIRRIMLPDPADIKVSNMCCQALKRFKMNFTLTLLSRTQDITTLIGFGTPYSPQKVSEQLFNELPLVNRFLDYFTLENQPLISLVSEHRVVVPSLSETESNQKNFGSLSSREQLLSQLGMTHNVRLTQREHSILELIAQGYPANYIAQKLHLSARTVENYLAVIKSKLSCESKVTLIQKAKQILLIQ